MVKTAQSTVWDGSKDDALLLLPFISAAYRDDFRRVVAGTSEQVAQLAPLFFELSGSVAQKIASFCERGLCPQSNLSVSGCDGCQREEPMHVAVHTQTACTKLARLLQRQLVGLQEHVKALCRERGPS